MNKKQSLIVFIFLCATYLGFGQISENIQTWTNHISYGTYTQSISAGTVNMTQCIVANAASATGTCSSGRVQMQASTGIIELPTLSSVGTIEVHLAAGASDRSVKLQYYNGLTWIDLITWTGIGTIGQTYLYNYNNPNPVQIRLASANNAVYVHDILVSLSTLTDEVDWANIQSPPNGTIDLGNNFEVYARVKENGVTNGPSQGPGLLCWIGYSTSNTNPNTWTNWIPATFIGNFGNNDELMLNLGAQISTIGTYYYASRFQLNGGPYRYGGYNAGGGGFWDSVYGSAPNDNESGQLVINARTPDWVNVQSPGSTNNITTGTSFFVYAQIYEPGITENSPATPGANIQAWIGYSTTDNDPSSSGGWTWVPAGHNTLCGANCGFPTENNDEYFVDIGSTLSPGTYYYASRFTIDDPTVYYYGGWSSSGGGFWNNTFNSGFTTDNISGELIITPETCSDLIISEYIEGSGNNKCLELFNPTVSSIDLSSYKIEIYANGSSSVSSTINLAGTITSGGTYIVCNPSADSTLLALSDITSGNISFNGNDAVVLVHSGATIDVIGQIGYDPGNGIGWNGGSASTVNRTLIRKNDIEFGDYDDYDTFDPNLEWNVFPIDDVSDLGFHFSDCIASNEIQLQLPIGLNVSCGDSYTFSTTTINNNNDVVLRIQNLGSLPLNISDLNFATGTHYALVSPPATPFSIAGNSYQNITIRFNPNTIGLLLDTLTILSDDSSEGSCSIYFSGISESNCSTTTVVLAAQNFEFLPSDTWPYIANHDGTLFPSNWGINTMLQFPDMTSSIASAQSGTYFWGITDLERSGHENQPHQLSFTYSGLNMFDNAQLSFYYYTIGIDNSDSFEYELFYDSVSQGIVDISADNDAWTQVLINIPNSVNQLDLIIYADLDAQYDLAGIDNISLTSTTINSTTWTSSGWSDGNPNINTVAILDDDYDTASNVSFTACSLIINDGFTLNIANGDFVEVQNDLTVNGNVIVQPQGAFVQINDDGIVDGNVLSDKTKIVVNKKTAPMNNWYEYTYWSSPVSGETINDGLAEAKSNRRFWFNAQNYLDACAESNNNNICVFGFQDGIDDDAPWDWTLAAGTDIMIPGVGYASTHDPNVFVFPGVGYDYTFEGPFNNGEIRVPVYRNDSELNDTNNNFIGNPYPSAIDVDEFFNINAYNDPLNLNGTLEGVIYLWSHDTEPSSTTNGNQVLNFSQSDYAIINAGVGETAGGDNNGDGLINSADKPNRFIPSGQGFFVDYSNDGATIAINDDIATGEVIFNNAMRVTGDNNQFFRVSNSKASKSKGNFNKLWINLTSDNGVFSQILVGYVNGATSKYDGTYYDTSRNSGLYSTLYSIILDSDEKFVIQGKATEDLNNYEVIRLGFDTKIDVATLYKLSIDEIRGDFFNTNTVYLKDYYMNTIHNLSESDYNFTSEVGEFKDRFEIVFQSKALSDIELPLNTKKLSIIELEDGRVQFKTNTNFTIAKVIILDLLGRTLYELKGSNTSEIYNLNNLSQSAYIAKVELSNGQIITKKTVKRK